MTPNPWPSWRAQTPSADFAERTVGAILRERNTRRHQGAARRWVLIAAAATVLVAGGAWGWTTLPRETPPRPAPSSVPAPALPTSDPTSRAVREPAERPDPPHRPPPPAMPSARRKEVPALSPSPDAGRRVIVPRCNCQEGICDCLEAH